MEGVVTVYCGKSDGCTSMKSCLVTENLPFQTTFVSKIDTIDLWSHQSDNMPVHFTCPHCGQLLSVTRRKVGQPVRCVQCKGGVLVPPPPEFEQSLAEQDSPDSQPESYQPSDIAENDPAMFETMVPPTAPFGGGTVELSRTAIYTVGGLLAGVAIVAFLLGWSFGSELSTHKQAANQPSAKRISGRITYVTNRGKNVPDTEAVVVAFPTKRKPDEKIAPAMMRPEISPANVPTNLLNAIRTLGGDFARTDRNGTYELEVSHPGEYFILVVSNHRSRGSRQPTTREIVEIGQFVTRATELLEGNDYVWSKRIVTQSLSYDYTFSGE